MNTTTYVKYPRTFHIPDSMGMSSDDRMLKDYSNFIGRDVVVTEKLDGEATTIYRDYIHARSIDSRHHWSRDWIKSLAAQIGWQINDNWRICGENLFAKHSIKYENLESYFYVYSVWDDTNTCLSWDDTIEYCSSVGLITVPVLYRGPFNKDLILSLWDESNRDNTEGFVIRNTTPFKYEDFSKNLGKFVRSNHVAPNSEHWFNSAIEKNELKQQ
jgi:hypothetical protein